METLSHVDSWTRQCLLYDLGFQADYKRVWDFQKMILNKRIAKEIPDSLILVEHDHVITLGRSAHVENVLTRDLPIYEIERGGDVTYHGPGQLVAYPIICLQERSLGIRQYIEKLELVIINTLSSVGINELEGKLGRETGVWIDGKRKIASIGVAVSHWVTYHGLALNVATDLQYFQKINPCGFESSIMTSVAKELSEMRVSTAFLKERLLDSFSSIFEFEIHRGSFDSVAPNRTSYSEIQQS